VTVGSDGHDALTSTGRGQVIFFYYS